MKPIKDSKETGRANHQIANNSASEADLGSPGGSESSSEGIEILYQKLGDKWFAFSLVNDDVFVGSIPVSSPLSESGSAGWNDGDAVRSTRLKLHRRYGNS